MKEIAEAYLGKTDEPCELSWNNTGGPGQKWGSIRFCSPLVHERPQCRHPIASSLAAAAESESMSTHTTTACLLPPPWLSMSFPFATRLTIALSCTTTASAQGSWTPYLLYMTFVLLQNPLFFLHLHLFHSNPKSPWPKLQSRVIFSKPTSCFSNFCFWTVSPSCFEVWHWGPNTLRKRYFL